MVEEDEVVLKEDDLAEEGLHIVEEIEEDVPEIDPVGETDDLLIENSLTAAAFSITQCRRFLSLSACTSKRRTFCAKIGSKLPKADPRVGFAAVEKPPAAVSFAKNRFAGNETTVLKR